MNTLNALEEVVRRHGRIALTDSIALTGALRSLPSPPPDADITALAAAAGAVEQMRAVLEQGGLPDQARAAAVAAVEEAVGDRAGWACDMLGRALGLLPRDPAEDATGTWLGNTPATDVTSTNGPISGTAPGRRRSLIGALAVAAVIVVAAVAVLVMNMSGGTEGPSTQVVGTRASPACGPTTTASIRTTPITTTPTGP